MKKLYKLWFVALLSCSGQPQNSEIKITNGVETNEFPAVVRIEVKSYDQVIDGQVVKGRVGPCTGTFISHDTVLTAAHCVSGRESYKYNGQDAIDRFIMPIYADGNARFDLALLRYVPNSAPAVEKIATIAPVDGDKITVVGYGYNEAEWIEETRDLLPTSRATNNVKRVGYNVYKDAENLNPFSFHIAFRGRSYLPADGVGTGVDAGASYGDSGGPLFIEGKGLSGVTSQGEWVHDGLKEPFNFYTSLLHEDAQYFFESARLYGFEF